MSDIEVIELKSDSPGVPEDFKFVYQGNVGGGLKLLARHFGYPEPEFDWEWSCSKCNERRPVATWAEGDAALRAHWKGTHP